MRRGFTLIELMIGIAVLITALLGLVGAFVGINALNESSRGTTLATNLADRVMEAIRDSDFQAEVRPNAQATTDGGPQAQNWIAWAATHNLPLTEPNLNNVSVDFDPPFEAGDNPPPSWTPTADPLRVRVTVRWTERSGRNRSAYLESLFTSRTQ